MKALEMENILDKEPYVDVKPLYDILNNCADNFKKYCVLLASIDIGIFDKLNTTQTINNLSRELGTDFNLTHNICESLKMLGLVKDRRYARLKNYYCQERSLIPAPKIVKRCIYNPAPSC